MPRRRRELGAFVCSCVPVDVLCVPSQFSFLLGPVPASSKNDASNVKSEGEIA